MKRIAFTLSLVIAAFAANSAFALSLHEAKDQGLVGEQQNGYLGAVPSNPPSEVRQLIEEKNENRKDRYYEIAKRNGTTVSAVEALAAKKAADETRPGHFFQSSSGKWMKK